MLTLAEGGTGFLPQPREPGTRPAAGPPGRFFTRFLLNCKYLSRRTHPNLISRRQASRLSQRRSREKGPLQGPSWREAVASFPVSALGCVWGGHICRRVCRFMGRQDRERVPGRTKELPVCMSAFTHKVRSSLGTWVPFLLSALCP